MISRLVAAIALVALVVLNGCGTMAELENENQQLAMRVDALELENAECAARISAAAERMSVLEQENLRLDDVNRQITQRVQSAPSGLTREDAALPPPQERSAATETAPVETTSETVGGGAAATVVARASLAGFSAGSAAAESFLTRYQAALTMYNAREFSQSAEAFSGLISEGHRNDMIDNCGYWIGECQYALGRYDEALQLFSDVIAFNAVSDKYDDALMMRGNCHVRKRDFAAAQKDFQTLIALDPPSELRARAQQKLQALR